MHGRLKVKTSKEHEEERKIKEREKAFLFENLKNRLFDLRPQIEVVEDHEEILKLTTELLLINPDFYTVWNIRRETLLVHAKRTPEEANRTWERELLFTRECLAKNEKSYSVWQHRIWVLLRMPKSVYETEIKLCNAFLDRDERNFHCWDYRSYICDIAQIDIEKEFQFTTDKINSECLNFSAWHRRHKLLSKGLAIPEDQCPKSVNLRLIWPEEYNMILRAVFIEPSDQAPWPYHNWLVKNNFGHLGQEQIDRLRELQQLEPDNKLVERAIELASKYSQINRSQRSSQQEQEQQPPPLIKTGTA